MIGAYLAPQQGNRYHAIRYVWHGGRSAWGSPFVTDFSTARQLTPLGSELWAWFSNAWKRVW